MGSYHSWRTREKSLQRSRIKSFQPFLQCLECLREGREREVKRLGHGMKQVFGAVYLQIVAAIVFGVLGVCLVVGSSLVGLYGRYFILSIHVQDGFDLRYQNRRLEGGEISEVEDHYNTGDARYVDL